MAPIEWLNHLHEQRDGYRRLVRDSGSLPAAAWALARAKCRSWETSTDVPTGRELRAAALTIARRTGMPDAVPNALCLAAECESRGLLVI